MPPKLPECPICFMPFNLTQRKPLYICQNSHSICRQCHTKYNEARLNSLCPLCKSKLNANIRQNNDIISLVKLHGQYQKVRVVDEEGEKQQMREKTVVGLSEDEKQFVLRIFLYIVMGIVGILVLVGFTKLVSSMLEYEKTLVFFVLDWVKCIIGFLLSTLVTVWVTLLSVLKLILTQGIKLIQNISLNTQHALDWGKTVAHSWLPTCFYIENILFWPIYITFWVLNFGLVLFVTFLIVLYGSILALKLKWDLQWGMDIRLVDFRMPEEFKEKIIFLAIYKFTKFVFDNYYLHEMVSKIQRLRYSFGNAYYRKVR